MPTKPEQSPLLIASGYLVNEDRTLLVLHRGFQKWVPPGGHVEDGETFSQAAEREFQEETGLRVRAISAASVIHAPDGNSTPEPVPFYVDIEREGFSSPALVQFFYVAQTDQADTLRPQSKEVDECRWFTADELQTLRTFDQVKSVAAFAITNYPSSTP